MLEYFKPHLAKDIRVPSRWSPVLRKWASEESGLFWVGFIDCTITLKRKLSKTDNMNCYYFQFHDSFSTFYKHHKHEDPNAPIVLLLHGLPSSSFDFSHVWEELCSRCTVVAPDFLGFGFSAKPKKHKYSFFEWATQVEELIRFLELQGREMHIFCFDIGVTVTQELLCRQKQKYDGIHVCYSKTERDLDLQPLNIQSVVACNGGCIKEHNFFKELTENHLLAYVLGRISFNKYMHHFTLSRVSGRRARKQGRYGLLQHFLDHWLQLNYYDDGYRVLPATMRALREQKYNLNRWRFVLRDTNVPIRFIDGPNDSWSGRHVAIACKELLAGKSNSDVQILDDDIGHFSHIEDPKTVMNLFWSFINEYISGEEYRRAPLQEPIESARA